MDSFFQVYLIKSPLVICTVAINHRKSPSEYRDGLWIHKVEILKFFIIFFWPGHFLMQIITRYLPHYIWLSKSLPFFKNKRALWEFLFDNIPLNLTQYAIFFFKIVYPARVVNDSEHLAVETRPKHLAESRTLAPDSRETPKKHGHILHLQVFVVLFNWLSHSVDEGNGWETEAGEGIHKHHGRSHIVLIEVCLNCWE